ncbi:MAG: hypothetical protein ACPGWR_26865 [Ardenticatenaceae bacterium]
MKRAFLMLLVFGMMLGTLSWQGVTAAPTFQSGCLFFTETAGGEGGYSVCDDDQAAFKTAFDNWGLQKVGYPISRRYVRDGFVTQAFQKAIMQWRQDGNYVALVNIFDDLHNDGFDDTLFAVRQTPYQLPDGWDGEGLTFEEVVAKRQALLDANSALRDAYFEADNPLLFYGLPTSEVEDMDNHYAIRLQRAVLQQWKEDVPWASAGQVTIANGGDITKELDALPSDALTPEAGPSEPQPTQAPEATAEPTQAPEATAEPTQVPEATAEPTQAPQPTAEPTQAPQPTAEPTPEPAPTVQLPSPSFNDCQADPNAGIAPNNPVRIVTVQKAGNPEVVQLQNVSDSPVDLAGWRMCSIRGNQEHTGISGTLAAGEAKDFPYTGNGSIWSNGSQDDGALYNANGQLVSYWTDNQ